MRPRVLVADDDEAVRTVVVEALSDAGYECVAARDGDEALALAGRCAPEAILLDVVMPGRDGEDVLAALRSDQRTRYIPVIFVTGHGRSREVARRLVRGADDHVVKPFDIDELVARVAAVRRRAAELRALNPLSGLPGNRAIATEIERHLHAGDDWCCLYCDVDHFKEFNDHYGFARGDELIVALAGRLVDVAERHPPAFVGHIGGDDFVLLVPRRAAVDVAREIVHAFDELAPRLYDDADRARGGIAVIDRHGIDRLLPVVTLSIGIVAISRARFADAVAVARAAAEVKEIAKRRDASSWAMDRRRGTAATSRAPSRPAAR